MADKRLISIGEDEYVTRKACAWERQNWINLTQIILHCPIKVLEQHFCLA